MVEAKLFSALGDPSRLEIVRRLSSGAPYTITTLLKGLKITRQGGRKHLQILADARVVKLKPKGRDTAVSLNHETLDQAKVFIEKLERQWDQRLEDLRRFVDGQ